MSFNNITGYNENGFTSYIPDEAYCDLLEAYEYAEDSKTPLTRRLEIYLPDHISHQASRDQYRYFNGLIRSFSNSKDFPAVIMKHRSSNIITSNDIKVDYLIHVPEKYQNNFDKVAQSWRFSPTVSSASHTSVVMPDGTVSSDFSNVFSATSPTFAARHPKLLHHPSGPILGHRTFYSRLLWEKHRRTFYGY